MTLRFELKLKPHRAALLDGEHQARVVERHPARLDVAEEDHPVRPPVLERVREDVGIHERAPGLSRSELPDLTPGVAQAERRLPGVYARAEELELEDRLD